ncbi:MAG TPA: VOC family protein [Candidatus Binataceae bacterium]|nr:VOC family protein [Candidatus Binataceae bacterium]
MKKRTGDPWMPADQYGRSLPNLTVNLLVKDMARSEAFYRKVLEADFRYSDPDFAAARVAGVDLMLHADHTYDKHPWYPRLLAGERRGLGAELRLLGIGPDGVEARAREFGSTIVRPPVTTRHGWREMMVEDPDGYVWAVGEPTPK